MSFSDFDLHLFREGTHDRLWEKLGPHPCEGGTEFHVWAPHAEEVAVAGSFNDWRPQPLERRAPGIWGGACGGAGNGARYLYRIVNAGRELWKADPYALFFEREPGVASVVWNLDYEWQDGEWMSQRTRPDAWPMTIYEVHLGSWRPGLGYREIGPPLAAYAKETGFTHIELLPLLEHPFYGSWGYQPAGYFAPTSRYGTPQDFMALVDCLHRAGLGVIVDWVPSHFADSPHGLASFDGTMLYERGREAQWNSHAFDYSKPEVRSFLRSSAMFWLERFHVDGLRVDAVASMLFRGGTEEDHAVTWFLQALTSAIHERHPQALLAAEDSSARPGVSHPPEDGGLGFDLKWDMGWMHDSLEYFTKPAGERRFHHGRLTFRPLYLWKERWVLPVSHDEVKPPFGSLAAKMPGDAWQKLANVRLLLAWMYAQPGKKLLFMGCEFAQWEAWNHAAGLQWEMLGEPAHRAIRDLTGLLNWMYRSERALHELESAPAGFEWMDCCDEEHSVVSFLRRGRAPEDVVLAVFNFTPAPQPNYRVGAPAGGFWKEILNTDAAQYGGSGAGNMGGVEASPIPWHGRRHSVNLLLPPLAAVWLKPGP